MPNNPNDAESTPLERAIYAMLHHQSPPAEQLSPFDQQLIEDLSRWLEPLHWAGLEIGQSEQSVRDNDRVSVRHDDPVALMLGLIPDQSTAIDGRRLKNARNAAGLKLDQLGDRLRARGWHVTTKDGFNWETKTNVQLSPALLRAICEELRIQESQLLIAPITHPIDELLSDERIEAFLTEWAAEVGADPNLVRDRARVALASAAFRNKGSGSIDALLGVLKVLRSVPGFLSES